nr:hypothetical protein [Chryseoglobus sp. 28M-23]
MHELPDRGGVDRLGCGDQRHAALLQVGHDDGVVGTVPGEAGQLVDDDVVDVFVAADALQHLLEGNALGHLCSRDTGLDVLGDDGQPELFGLALAGLPLGGDRDAFGVIVGVDLTFG